MKTKISSRLLEVVNALPLREGKRVLEIGCGTGTAAREIANHIKNGQVLAIDRSAKSIQLAIKNSQNEIASGKLNFRQVAIEKFDLEPNEPPFDIAFAIRVGALNGRHPKLGQLALPRIARALVKNGKLYIDGGNPLREIPLDDYR